MTNVHPLPAPKLTLADVERRIGDRVVREVRELAIMDRPAEIGSPTARDYDAECTIIASTCAGGMTPGELGAWLLPDDFTDTLNRYVFAAIVDAQVVDLDVVAESLSRSGVGNTADEFKEAVSRRYAGKAALFGPHLDALVWRVRSLGALRRFCAAVSVIDHTVRAQARAGQPLDALPDLLAAVDALRARHGTP